MPKIINVYLSGPMYLGKEHSMIWRNNVKTRLRNWTLEPGNGHVVQFNILDPCDRWYEKGKEFDAMGGYVVQIDKMEIEKSHVVIVNSTDPGWGTPMEQYIAYSSGNKMVLAFSECEFPSIWAVHHSHMMFKSEYEAVDFLCSIAKNLAKVV